MKASAALTAAVLSFILAAAMPGFGAQQSSTEKKATGKKPSAKKSTTAKSTAGKSPTSKSTVAKGTAARSTKSSAAKSTAAKSTATKSTETKSGQTRSTSTLPSAKAGASKSTASAADSSVANGTTSKSTTEKTGAKATSKNPKQASSRYHRSSQQQPTADRYKEIQQALADKGYFAGTPDGQWGASSVDALKRFQHDQSLNEDGKIGAVSLIALGLGPKRGASDKVDPDKTPPDKSAGPGADSTSDPSSAESQDP